MSVDAASRRVEFLLGARDTIPMVIGATPFAILFGALATSAGLSLAATVGMSLFVFAGSAQFVAASLLVQGTGIAVIILTTFIVNLRHALYSAALGPHVRGLPQRWLMPLGFLLTDETFAVVIKRYRETPGVAFGHWYFLGSACAMYFNWQVFTLVGIFAGHQMQGLADWGLEFAMVVTFIGIVVPLITDKPMVICAVVAIVVALAARDLPHNLGLILASLLGIASGYLAENAQSVVAHD